MSLTTRTVLGELIEAVEDVIFEGRVRGYDTDDGPSIDDPLGGLGRLHAALNEARKAMGQDEAQAERSRIAKALRAGPLPIQTNVEDRERLADFIEGV